MNKLLPAAAVVCAVTVLAGCSDGNRPGSAYPSAANDLRPNSNAISPAGPAADNDSGRINERGNGGGGGGGGGM
jgi:hypothetical protein